MYITISNIDYLLTCQLTKLIKITEGGTLIMKCQNTIVLYLVSLLGAQDRDWYQDEVWI